MKSWVKTSIRVDGEPVYFNQATLEVAVENLGLARLVPVPSHQEQELLSLALREAAALGRGCSHTG